MKKFCLFTMVLLALLGCTDEVPEGILPPGKMQMVMWDMLQADELTAYEFTKDSTEPVVSNKLHYYQNIYQIHQISREEFRNSMEYYQSHPELLKTVLDSIQSMGERLVKKDTSTRLLDPILIE